MYSKQRRDISMYKDKNKIIARSLIIFFLSNAGKKVGKITIQSGFSLEGTVNVFGYTLEAVIKVSPTEVHVKVEMSPRRQSLFLYRKYPR